MAESLFEQVVRLSGLSSIFAKSTVIKAAARAGVSPPEALSRSDLGRVFDELRPSLVAFLGEQAASEAARQLDGLVLRRAS